MASEDFRCEENVRTEFLLMRMGYNITYSMQKFREIDVTSSFTKRKSPDTQKNNQSEKHTAVLICVHRCGGATIPAGGEPPVRKK